MHVQLYVPGPCDSNCKDPKLEIPNFNFCARVSLNFSSTKPEDHAGALAKLCQISTLRE